MDLVRNILSHFKKNKANKQPPITVNGVTIQQINKNLQQNDDTEPKNEEFIEIAVPPHKRLKKNNNGSENSNITKAILPADDKQTIIPIDNNAIIAIIDLTDTLEEQNVLQNNETAENSNFPEAKVPSDEKQTTVLINNDAKNTIIDLTDNLEIQIVLEIGETTENSNISEASDDKEAIISVNNNNIEFKNNINKDSYISEDTILSGNKESAASINNDIKNNTIIDDTCNLNTINLQDSQNIVKIGDTNDNTNISKEIIRSDDQETVVSVDNNTTIEDTSNPKSNNVQNISEIGETDKNRNITEDITVSDDKQTAISINNNANNTTIGNTDNSHCNKLHKSQNNPEMIPNNSENINNVITLDNDTEETTTTCIKEFEDILANVENELILDLEISLDEVNDLMNDLIFCSNDEIHISDAESEIPIHIVRKDVETNIPTNNIDFCYDFTIEAVDPNKPVDFLKEINYNNTERDATINTTSKNSNSIVTDGNNAKKANTSTSKPENYDTISLSSDDNTNIKDAIYISDSPDSDCGYHSSDFEFITEEEAKRDGIIINFKPDKLKHKDFNAKPDSRQPKRRKITSNSNNVKAGPTKTLKVPNNTKNVRGRRSKPLRKTSSDQPRSSQNITARTNGIDVQAGPSNPVQMPSIVQAGPSNLVQTPLNIQAGSRNPVQIPSIVQAGPNNPVQRLSNIQAGYDNPVQTPSNVLAGPSNPFQRPSNVQVGPSNPVQMPSIVQAGPSNPDQMPSIVQAGPSNPVQMPSIVQAGPSNPVQIPLNIQAGQSNSVQTPSNVQPNAVNNYESYRNKYRKPFKIDTTYRNNHNEPPEEGFFDLFRGFHAAAGITPRYISENKSTKSQYANPSMWYQGVGFDLQMMRGNSSDEEDDQFNDEANETVKKIRSMFP